jgi:hypothetical protein
MGGFIMAAKRENSKKRASAPRTFQVLGIETKKTGKY